MIIKQFQYNIKALYSDGSYRLVLVDFSLMNNGKIYCRSFGNKWKSLSEFFQYRELTIQIINEISKQFKNLTPFL